MPYAPLRKGPVYRTQWWSPLGRKGKWMSTCQDFTAGEAVRSIVAMKKLRQQCRITLTYQEQAKPGEARQKPMTHTLIVREWDNGGRQTYENKQLAILFDQDIDGCI